MKKLILYISIVCAFCVCITACKTQSSFSDASELEQGSYINYPSSPQFISHYIWIMEGDKYKYNRSLIDVILYAHEEAGSLLKKGKKYLFMPDSIIGSTYHEAKDELRVTKIDSFHTPGSRSSQLQTVNRAYDLEQYPIQYFEDADSKIIITQRGCFVKFDDEQLDRQEQRQQASQICLKYRDKDK